MIRLTDTDGDPILIADGSIAVVLKYRHVARNGVVEHVHKKEPNSVVHTITGGALLVLEDIESIQQKLSWGEVTGEDS